jgi:hypothetical protein
MASSLVSRANTLQYGIAYTIVITIFLLFPPLKAVTAENMNYAVVAFAVIIIISAIQWFVDGRRNFTGPSFDEFTFASIEGTNDEETQQVDHKSVT